MSERAQDPWGDMPRWSDARAGEGLAVPAATSHGTGPDAGPAAAPDATPPAERGAPSCPWCGAQAAPDATRCMSCGAALAQRESIGDLVIPGLTAVDPALKDLDGRPLHISGPSPSQGAASGIIVAAAAGGPLGLAILGGVGAMAAAEYLRASREVHAADAKEVGQVSAAVRQALERLERGERLDTSAQSEPVESSGTAAPDGATRIVGAPPGSPREFRKDGT